MENISGNENLNEDVILDEVSNVEFITYDDVLDTDDMTNSENNEIFEEMNLDDKLMIDFNKILDEFNNEMNLIRVTAKSILPKILKEENENRQLIDELVIEFNNKIESVGDLELIDSELILSFIQNIKKNKFNHYSKVILKSFFLNVFSEFDSFLNNMLWLIFKNKSQLVNSSEKSYLVNEIMKFDNLDDFKNVVISKEIESIIRKSYIEQFSIFEKKFSINTLKKFDNWNKFVEISQRRNLVMHCDGKINTQYVTHCLNHNCFDETLQLNDKIGIDNDYLFESINIVNEVGVKLFHVIFRTQFEHLGSEFDGVLTDFLYDLLIQHDYKFAQVMGEYVVNIPKYANKSEQYLNVINYAIALKQIGLTKKMSQILSKYDWSSVLNEYKLAYAVLNDNTEDIIKYMKIIGKTSEIITKEKYVIFPIFEFIKEKEFFKKTFREIFDEDYSVVLAQSEFDSEILN